MSLPNVLFAIKSVWHCHICRHQVLCKHQVCENYSSAREMCGKVFGYQVHICEVRPGWCTNSTLMCASPCDAVVQSCVLGHVASFPHGAGCFGSYSTLTLQSVDGFRTSYSMSNISNACTVSTSARWDCHSHNEKPIATPHSYGATLSWVSRYSVASAPVHEHIEVPTLAGNAVV